MTRPATGAGCGAGLHASEREPRQERAGRGGVAIRYIITVTNNGPAIAENMVMTDALPANTTFASLQVSNGGWNCSTPAVGAAGTVNCSGGNRSNGDVTGFTLIVAVNPAFTSGLICNTAIARSDIVDNTPGNSAFTCSGILQLVVDRGDDDNIAACTAAANDCTLRGRSTGQTALTRIALSFILIPLL